MSYTVAFTPEAQEQLLEDIDARLFRLEAGEHPEPEAAGESPPEDPPPSA